MPDLMDSLAASIRQRRVILFAGAGISMTVGLPSWRDLMAEMCRELGLAPEDTLDSNGVSYQTLAEYYRLTRGDIEPLRRWMEHHWSVSAKQVEASAIHRLIVELDFPIIYTTNYDHSLEVAHKVHGRRFAKIANARDLSHVPEGVTQIVKFHGDLEDEGSLVLTETDYFNRLSFDSPLDVRLRSDALARTVLFVGYSLSDLNIRLLLHELWQTWRNSGFEKDRPPSFIFLPDSNPLQEAVLGQWGVKMIAGRHADPEQALQAFLAGLAERVGKASRPSE